MTSAACRRLVVAASLAVAGIGAAPAPPSRAAAARPYVESVEVVQTSVLVAPPPGLRRPWGRIWLVRENGADRPVERIEALGDEPWEVLVWIDGPLCRQKSLARTLIALARETDHLTRFGPVRVVVADPDPRTVVGPTRESRALAQTLASLSAQTLCTAQPDALFWRARGMSGPPESLEPISATRATAAPVAAPGATVAAAETALHDLQSLVERRSELLAAATGRCNAAACALLLVAHGYPFEPDLRIPLALRTPLARQVGAALAATTESLAQRLATGRWLLFALPFAPPPAPGDDPESERPLPPELRPGPAPFPDMGDFGPPGMPSGPAHLPRVTSPPAAQDVYLLPEFAPLRRLAELTAGAILRLPEQLPEAISALRSRRWLWYRTTPFQPGEARALQVLVGSPPQRAMAPAWVGASGKR